MQEGFQLRDVFNPGVVTELAQAIQRTWPQFDAAGFSADINPALPNLGFGQRNALIRDKLYQYLPQDFPTAAQILIDSLGPELNDLAGFDAFTVMSQCDFVAMYGLAYFDVSMQALYEMTKRFTAEGAIRPFLMKYPDQTLQRLEQMAHDPNPLARRLASEGTRPRLPLAPRLPQFIKDPRPVLKLLDLLKADPTLLVRRSVANNLNDIAKDNPDIVVETLQAWQQSNNNETQWLIQHASRTLVKQGHRGALSLLGYTANPATQVEHLVLKSAMVVLGGALEFQFNLHADGAEPQNLIIDYVIHHMKASGKLAPKVFKFTTKKLKPGETVTLVKKHPLRPINTRQYYPGRHLLEIQINGVIQAQAEFELRIA
jgi:3-methyladenine DNA glycosylase AlkC